MKEKFISLLQCPKSKEGLILKKALYYKDGRIESGELTTANGTYSYPIINGIPRFVDTELYSESFGYEWKKWSKVQYESENSKVKISGFTTKMFELSTKFSDLDIKDKTIVEFGCGGGRYMDVALKKGAMVVGIDLSIAVEPANKNLAHYDNYLIVQGDILNSPFKDNVFDHGYSIGVLHHTPSPKVGLKELFRTIKPGGYGTCLVYQNDGWYSSKSIKYYRYFFNKTNFIFGNSLALIYSHISARFFHPMILAIGKIPLIGIRIKQIIERNFLVINYLPNLKWRILDTFDAITPKYASTHSSKEVKSWFEDEKCKNITMTEWSKCGWKGQKV